MDDVLERISVDQFKNVMKMLDSSMDDYLYIYDLQNDYYCISQNAVSKFLFPDSGFYEVDKNLEKVVFAEDKEMLDEELRQVISGEKAFHDCQYRWVDKEHRPVWINCRGRVIRDDEGRPEFLVGCVNEIGNKQKADNISGLLGESSMKKEIIEHDGRLHGFILRVGIDRFKEINENKGMDYGDMILKRTADCIASVIEPDQKLYRIVADEFAIVDLNGRGEENAIALYEKIRQKVIEFIRENKYEVFYTLSAGILMFDSVVNHTYYNVMKLSEFALNEAKNQGKNKYCIYSRQAYHDFRARKDLTRVMRHAVNHNFEGFTAFFQPVVDVNTRKIIGAETLLRFCTEETGPVPPVKFIPLLEESGLIIPVGRWVIQSALEACSRIQPYIPGFKVSMNVSYVQVLRSNVLADLISYINWYQLPPNCVQVELTESGFLEEDENFLKFCDGLRNYGIMLALDDFGTGYSNFHYLSYLNPDTIKIDRSFTAKALQNKTEYNLLERMTDMCHSVQSRFCIEGVETKEELETISRMGPDYVQGYFFGKPCPFEDFMKNFVDNSENTR